MLNSKYCLTSHQISRTLSTPCYENLNDLFASCFISLYLRFYRPKKVFAFKLT